MNNNAKLFVSNVSHAGFLVGTTAGFVNCAIIIGLMFVTSPSFADEELNHEQVDQELIDQNFDMTLSVTGKQTQTDTIDSEPDVPETGGMETGDLKTGQSISPPLTGVISESSEVVEQTMIDAPKYNDVLTAVLRGDIKAVQQLLDLGRWVDKPGDSSGTTPLMAAVMNRDADMVQYLLEHGAQSSPQALKLAKENKDATTILLLEQLDEH
ncbi:MAG: ankyrin repeat domain-containing protein [Gallionella sp.]